MNQSHAQGMFSRIVLVLALGLCPPSFSDARAEAVEAYTRAEVDLRLAFTVSGRVEAAPVREGDRVRKGETLIALADPEGEAQIRLLEVRAASTLEIDAATADENLARVREGMVKSAAQRGGASEFEAREAELETVRARLAKELFVQRREEARMQLEQARRRHEQFALRAPASGVVDEIGIEVGETVEALAPVMRLVSTETLLADAQAPIAQTLGLKAGDRATATFLLGERRIVAEARVRFVALVGDAASDTRRVLVEIPNERGLPAGTRVLIDFASDAASAGLRESPSP